MGEGKQPGGAGRSPVASQAVEPDTLAGSDPEVWTSERCFITEVLNQENTPGVSLALCRVPVGITTQWHRLSVSEWYLIRQGEGLLELAQDPGRRVGPGDNILIPPGTPQRITNTGSKDLRFFCLCQPRFRPDCYESLEVSGV